MNTKQFVSVCSFLNALVFHGYIAENLYGFSNKPMFGYVFFDYVETYFYSTRLR